MYYTQEDRGSDLSRVSGYPDWGIQCSLPHTQLDIYFQIRHNCCLPHDFQFNIPTIQCYIMYTAEKMELNRKRTICSNSKKHKISVIICLVFTAMLPYLIKGRVIITIVLSQKVGCTRYSPLRFLRSRRSIIW